MQAESAPENLRLFCVCLFVGWPCEYNTRKGNSSGRSCSGLLPPGITKKCKETQMSTTIPLNYRVDYEIGLDAKDLTPIQIQEISAQQAISSCGCLFYLLRQAAISEPHHPLFNLSMFLHALEQITMLGEALSNAAYDHVENLAGLKAKGQRVTKQ
jgi:hypothetical protein